MRNCPRRNPFQFFSGIKDSRLCYFAGEPGKGGSASQQDDAEPDPNTPAGKKWAALRERAKVAEDDRAKEREARIKAEAKAEAFEEWRASVAPPAKKEEAIEEDDEELAINPKDRKIVSKIFDEEIKRRGLDQVPGVVEQLKKGNQEIQANTTLRDAKANLEAEFQGSVPFDYEATMAYAKANGYGTRFSNAQDALRYAHKDMNEQKFIEFYRSGESPDNKKKKTSQIVRSGRSERTEDALEEDPQEVKVESLSDMKKAMFAQLGVDDEI